jgi:hypothetical protein
VHAPRGLRRVWAWIWAWIWAQRGGGVFGGVFGGGLGGVVGGEGAADKGEREGRCTSIGPHPSTDLTPSVVNFVRCCSVTCTGAAFATREAPATKTTRTKSGVSGENADWNVRVQILTPFSPAILLTPWACRIAWEYRLYTAIKIPTRRRYVWAVHDMRYKRMVLLAMGQGHDVSTGRHPPWYGAWIEFRVNALCYLCEGGTTRRSALRHRTGRMMDKTLHVRY